MWRIINYKGSIPAEKQGSARSGVVDKKMKNGTRDTISKDPLTKIKKREKD